MSDRAPLGPISVLITSYNAMPYLPDAVESIRAQTYPDWELILVDDGSTDETGTYLDGLDDPRIRIVRAEHAGRTAALNRGLHEATHRWLAIMDADDVAHPERLAREADFLADHPDVALVSCGNGYIGRDGQRLSLTAAPALADPPRYNPVRDGMILNQGVLADRERILALGGWRELVPAEDFDLCLRLAEVAPLAAIPDPLMLVRILPGGISSSRFVEQRVCWEYVLDCARARAEGNPEPDHAEYMRTHRPKGSERRHILAQRHFRLGGAAWVNRMRLGAAGHLLAAFCLHPALLWNKARHYLRKGSA